MATVNYHDMIFILTQIKIAEAHANGIPLTQIRLNVLGEVITDPAWYNSPDFDPTLPLAIPDAKVPFGLRTVDGSYNNIVEGRELWGAADQPMPRLLTPYFINENDDQMALGGSQVVTNNDYEVVGVPSPVNGGNTGNVVDADPRIISNLIVDMSFNNPAAIVAALTYAGSEDVFGDLELVQAAYAVHAATLSSIYADATTTDDEKQAAADAARADFATEVEQWGLVVENGSLVVPNVAADEGLSAPFNGWMSFFGQFFDHGLDLITKSDNGTIYIPLASDDPLITHGPDGIAGTGDEVSPQTAFMALTRSKPVDGPGADGILGTADDTGHEAVNATTPFVDQNQTYTSHPSHQVFLREYATVNGRTASTGRLLDGAEGGLATWADVKAQALTMLGIELSDTDVFNVPLLRTDQYGRFIPDPETGYAQVILGIGADGIPNTADDIVISGTPDDPINLIAMATSPVTIGGINYFGPIRTSHAFLDDIAHNAVPGTVYDADGNSTTAGTLVVAADDDDIAGNEIATDFRGRKIAYDDELLDAHFVTGDGRGNENIALTTVHHVFHSEHNRQVAAQKLTILNSGDLAFINEWLVSDIGALPTNFASLTPLQQTAFAETLNWDGERLFQAGRFATEMQYQHLVFEEFARLVQPAIDPFVFNSAPDINPAIFAEFAHTVYRFGHSMLTENVSMINADGSVSEVGLIEAFLNPVSIEEIGTLDEATAAIVGGMVRVRGNEIDEFVTNSLRNNLLGLPLDLAAINIARGRDAGIPTLNMARQELYAATGSTFLTPYDNWVDFAANLKNPVSVVNFIAAYGKNNALLDAAVGMEEKREVAWYLVFGDPGDDLATRAARIEWLNSSAATSGVNDIDFWIGGLAEKKMPFGGMLGSTFNAVFEAQLENLQDGDRFYYLTRTQGLNFLNQLEENSFSKLIMKNSTLAEPGPDGIRGTPDDIVPRHIGINAFANYDYYLEVNAAMQIGADPVGNDPVLEGLGRGKVQRDDAAVAGLQANYLRFTGGEHVSVGGTNNNDTIITDFGDDSIWGDAGNDRIEAGAGVDLVNGGAGNDIITDSGDSGDFLKGEAGDDVIANSNGIDILMGGTGKDAIFVGVDDTEVFGGEGDDFIVGGDGVDLLMGNEGDDWIEGGAGFDTTAGDNSDLFFNSTIIGHDVMFAGSDEHDFDAESGDDIMVQGESVMRNEGMFGFDWATFQGANINGYADMRIKIFTTEPQDILRNRFDKVEALSGWNGNDTLIGDDRTAALDEPPVGTITPDVVAANEGVFFKDELSQAGVNRIEGLRALISGFVNSAPAGATAEQLEALVAFNSGNLLLGGAGNDTLQGNGGDDVLFGDHYLQVRIRVTGVGQENTAANQIATISSMREKFGTTADVPAEFRGKTLFELMLSRTIEPSQMHIVREIKDGNAAGNVDTAVFWDVRANYQISLANDGAVIVTHTSQTAGAGRPSDGTDRLYRIEQLRFADGTFATQSLLNVAATGAPLLSDLTPTQGSALTLDLTQIADANGFNLAAASVAWQVQQANGTWANVSTSTTTFTPGAGQVGLPLRVVVSFTDNGGNAEQVISEVTAPIGLLFNGTNAGNTVAGTAGSDTLNGNGGADIMSGLAGDDLINGGAGNDTLSGDAGADVMNGDAGNDTLNGGADNDTLSGGTGNDILDGDGGDDALDGGAGADALNGGAGDDLILGGAGVDTITGGGGNDTISGGADNDTINAGAGDDIINWSVGDGRDTVNGGGEGAAGDRVVITGSAAAETYTVWTRAAFLAAAGNAGQAGNVPITTEILITRNGTNFNSVIMMMNEIEEITINGGGGGDTFVTQGNFAPTQLNTSTLTFVGSSGNDTLNITGLQSPHRVIFQTAGGTDRVLGTLRAQDVIDLPNSTNLTWTAQANGTTTLRSTGQSVNFAGSPEISSDGISVNIANGALDLALDSEDISDLIDLVRSDIGRSASGYGNNIDDPTQGIAGQNFIRLTEASYSDGARSMRTTTLTPREISDIVSNQDNDGDGVEEDMPNAFGGTALLTAFGQYFDHGLDFIAKGGSGTAQIGSSDFPITASRATIKPGTGVDGIPAEYVNDTSPYVDQNQAYGSSDAVTDLLRKWENGSQGTVKTGYLLTGELDASGHANLPTLYDVRENYKVMTGGSDLTWTDIANYDGTGQPLLLDFKPPMDPVTGAPIQSIDGLNDYYITGDGRANENVMLTSIHTIWARNHNYWVDRLKDATNNTWTEDEYFEAARTMNIAEYQRVVFTEFAVAMAGGLDDPIDDLTGDHGFEGYDPTVDASISLEFSQAAYRFGHSMLNEDVTYVDSAGVMQSMSLVDAFLSPNKVAEIGVEGILEGAAGTLHQAIDVDIVNALRNQLIGRPLDLAALNIFRGRDVGLAAFNQVRAELFAKTGNNALRPYTGWTDFQIRNGLTDAFIATLKAAYPDGFETMDLWVGGLAEKPVDGQLGSTFGYIFLEQLDRLQHGDRLYYLEIFDDSMFDGAMTFSEIIMRNTDITDMADYAFQPVTPPSTPDPVVPGTIVGTAGNNTLNGTSGDDVIDGLAGNDTIRGAAGNDDLTGGEGNDTLVGGAGDDTIHGNAGADRLAGGTGNDTLLGGAGNDQIAGGSGSDNLQGGIGADTIQGGGGRDTITGGAGQDNLDGGGGNDEIQGGGGADFIDGGAGADRLTGGAGRDIIVFGGGDTVTDFAVGQDKIDLNGVNITAARFNRVIISADGDDTLLTIGTQIMRLENTASLSITSASFVFDGTPSLLDDAAVQTLLSQMEQDNWLI